MPKPEPVKPKIKTKPHSVRIAILKRRAAMQVNRRKVEHYSSALRLQLEKMGKVYDGGSIESNITEHGVHFTLSYLKMPLAHAVGWLAVAYVFPVAGLDG